MPRESTHVSRGRVQITLLIALALCLGGLPFLSHAPNRLLSGTGISVFRLVHGHRAWVALVMAGLPATTFLCSGRWNRALVLAFASATFSTLVWLAGDEAARLADPTHPFARTAFGAGFWSACLVLILMGANLASKTHASAFSRTVVVLLVPLPALVLFANGHLDQTSILLEYANRKDAFYDAFWQHLRIVVLTVVPALTIGIPLGILSSRRVGFGRALFPTLNLIQTIPSIALFGLLIAPLAALVARLPLLATFGIAGIGITPAVVALTLYALLPVARSTQTGLQSVPDAVKDAATGMGMTPAQIFWRIELPLALPIIVSGARVTTVQAIGLASVAALIGAGGFGALMFQGLLGSALDLVLLGVVPVVLLAAVTDTLFKLGLTFLETSPS
jgi:osmoprotectant transport system permease protein